MKKNNSSTNFSVYIYLIVLTYASKGSAILRASSGNYDYGVMLIAVIFILIVGILIKLLDGPTERRLKKIEKTKTNNIQNLFN